MPDRATAKRNIWLCLGTGLVLILNATSAETTGITALGQAVAHPFSIIADHVRSVQNPLSASDARHYTLAFSAASVGHWEDAQIEAARTSDRLLQGDVLAACYLAPGYQPDYSDLAAWLTRYPDLPDAAAIHRLAETIRPSGAILPMANYNQAGLVETDMSDSRLPGVGVLSRIRLTGTYKGANGKAVNRLVTALSSHLRDDAAVTALRVLDTSPATALLEQQDLSAIQTRIAAGLLYDGQNGAALRLAQNSLDGEASEEALWTAGLAAYRLERYSDARDHFEAIGRIPDGEPWTNSAAAFWAAKASLNLHDAPAANRWFAQAASYHGTFYGMLAERTLGQQVMAAAEPPRLSSSDARTISSIPAGRRALALMQIGQADRAEAELRQIEVSSSPGLRDSLRLYALQLKLPDLAQRISIGLTGDGADQSYPRPSLQPKGGYITDPALIYAIMRQESRFDPAAESDAGAIGLMQIMPQTAAAISPRTGAKENWRLKLRDPQTNVDLGQRYVQTLLSTPSVSGNLLMMAAAYNSGPGNLTRWRGDKRESDPLMFLETLPAEETRGFVEQVMTNYWIYQLQMRAGTPSLSQMAAGEWPIYQPTAPKPMLVAERN